jgi:hypothetical protein
LAAASWMDWSLRRLPMRACSTPTAAIGFPVIPFKPTLAFWHTPLPSTVTTTAAPTMA